MIGKNHFPPSHGLLNLNLPKLMEGAVCLGAQESGQGAQTV